MWILGSIITTVIVIIVVATAFPVLWDIALDASENISAMTGTDAGTTTIQAFFPIVLMLVGLGIAVGLIMYAVKKFRVMS